MKTILFTFFILPILICSCKDERKDLLQVQVRPSEKLQLVIDSLMTRNKNKKEDTSFELFVDNERDFRYHMILHIGKKPYYEDDVLSTCYFLSGEQKISIYTGVESYFNLPRKPVFYRNNGSIKENNDHQIWIIRLHKDSIAEVYSTESVNPYLLITSSPKDVILPNLEEY